VEPVTARLYPQGKSLDWCMERREQLGGEAATSVEKILKREAKEAERKSLKRAADEKRRDDSAKSLFDFINVKLGGGNREVGLPGEKKSKNGFSNNKNNVGKGPTVDIREETTKGIKIRQFEMGEKITRIERDISKYKTSYERLKEKDPKSAGNMKAKMEGKVEELRKVRHSERKLNHEESSRKSKSKLTIF
jgi:hypothetical protein